MNDAVGDACGWGGVSENRHATCAKIRVEVGDYQGLFN